MIKGSAVSKNYLFGTKISFLIFSFIIFIIAVTVHHDIWPFLEENLPPQTDQQPWFLAMIIVGFLLPLFWLRLDWSIRTVRYSLISLIIMLFLQMLTEITVSHYFFISMVIPTSILYIGYRLIQLINLQRLIYQSSYPSTMMKTCRTAAVGFSFVFWGILWFRLTFVTFPKIIPDIF